jgi:surface carbohydrate biosynthesis protein (TIGR04326 family)
MVVWDLSTDPPESAADVLCWGASEERTGVTSVPLYVEDHAERLRAKYLAFIHDLGESQIDGRRVVDHLSLGDGPSFWWLTLLAEKSPLKSPGIFSGIRLFALEEILVDRRPPALELVSADRDLADAVRTLCVNLRIGFEWRSAPGRKTGWSLRAIYRTLPYPVQGLVVFAKHLVGRWPLRTIAKPPWLSGSQAVFICSYFVHLNPAASADGLFRSGHWGPLPDLLHKNGRQINWLQHFMHSPLVPDPGTAARLANRFNRAPETEGVHAFVDTYLSFHVVGRVMKDWLRLNATAWRLRSIESSFRPSGSALSLWPILRADWRSSLVGSTAVGNCLWVALFDAALRDLPRQSAGFFLYENQGWERAMVHAWRKHGHGEIIGVQHATAPFWHLYYFDDPRTWLSRGINALPQPDRVALNGPDAWKAFVRAGYPAGRLVETEALRYIDLLRKDHAISKRPDTRTANARRPEVKVLILGDMMASTMDRFLALVENACDLLPPGYRFTFKPHPANYAKLSTYPRLKADETTEPLGRIMGDYDITVAANSTTAAVEAFAVGLPTIIMLDGTRLNLSPLRGQAGVQFVSTPEQLAKALRGKKPATPLPPLNQEMFYLDALLPRWRQLLASAGTARLPLRTVGDENN